VPIDFAGNGNEIAATAFILTYDPAQLNFDASDGNGDGIPDSVVLKVPQRYIKNVTADGKGRIQVALSDVALPLIPLADGSLATFTFTAAASADGQSAAVSFADDYPVSVASTKGASLPVSAQDGSVLIKASSDSGGSTPVATETPTPATPQPEVSPTEVSPTEVSPTEVPPTEVPTTEVTSPETPTPGAPTPTPQPNNPEPQAPGQPQYHNFLPMIPKS
jgi:hypothetical protein